VAGLVLSFSLAKSSRLLMHLNNQKRFSDNILLASDRRIHLFLPGKIHADSHYRRQ
jgi:hypothetical protein